MRWLTAIGLSLVASAVLCAAAASRSEDKIPPPSSETVELERRKLLERVGVADPAGLSKSASAKLARRLLDEAKAATAGSDAQFVALELAWRCAVDGAEVELALESLDKLEGVFALDSAARHVEAFKGLARNASGSKIKLVLARALEFARRSIDLEDFESALELLDDVKLRKFARDDADSLPLYESLWTDDVRAFKTMREWLAKLETSPQDPEANHYAGYYYCFERRDFERGLAHLAQSHLEAFKAIAALDSAAPSDAAGCIGLSRSWSQFVDEQLGKPRAKLAGLARARHWLARARNAAPSPDEAASLERHWAELGAAEAALESERSRPKVAKGGAANSAKKSRAPALQRESQALVDGALAWLAEHQLADGRWSSRGFPSACEAHGVAAAQACGDVGEESHDVGVTALALEALIAGGSDAAQGPYAEAVQRGVFWLIGQQSAETGLIGPRVGAGFIYSHAAATIALAHAQHAQPSDELAGALQRAVATILAARNANSGWRYELSPTGESDTSVTAWMVRALCAAERAGIAVDEAAGVGALRFIDAMTDVSTARVGYANPGSISARVNKINDQFNAQRGECLTGAGLLVRLLLGQNAETSTLVARHAELIARKPPTWAVAPSAEAGVDFYGWYYGSLALHGVGEPYSKAWFQALRAALAAGQRKDGHAKGSWDAACDPWGFSGGRVYATAMGALALLAEVDDSVAIATAPTKK